MYQEFDPEAAGKSKDESQVSYKRTFVIFLLHFFSLNPIFLSGFVWLFSLALCGCHFAVGNYNPNVTLVGKTSASLLLKR